MKKKILSFIMASILSVALIGCGNNLANKSIESAKTFIENKEYDKALLSLEIALDEEPENGEANKLYRILEKYIESKSLVDNNKFHEAEEVINKLDSSLFAGLSIEEDINAIKESINKHKEEEEVEEAKKKEESESEKELAKQESDQESKEELQNTYEVSKEIVQEEQGICMICEGIDVVSNLSSVTAFGRVHTSCYNSLPVCSICSETKLWLDEDKDGNGICDYKCDRLCTNCWINEANVKGGLCNDCEWKSAYANKATCDGCEGNIVDASLAGTICPDCGYEFKVIPVN